MYFNSKYPMYNSKFWELAFKNKIKMLFLTINQLIENKVKQDRLIV